MRCVVQRVKRAMVTVEGREVASISKGLLVFVACDSDDDEKTAETMAKKIAFLRIFPSRDGSKGSDISVSDVNGEVLVVPQFTLMGDVRKGNRPSFSSAADPEIARDIVESLSKALEAVGLEVKRGLFREYMQVTLANDGPYTILIDSEKNF